MRICYICKVSRSLDHFYRGQYKCKDCHREYMKNYWRNNPEKRDASVVIRKARIRQEVNDYKESKGCMDCGIKYPSYVLQFDHLRDKEFMISTHAGNIGTKRLWDEISKCDVVCANCHAVRTHNRLMPREI